MSLGYITIYFRTVPLQNSGDRGETLRSSLGLTPHLPA